MRGFVIVGLLVALVAAETHIMMLCTDTACGDCTNKFIPENTCSGNNKAHCVPSDATCLDMIQFAASDTDCKTMDGRTRMTLVCGRCMQDGSEYMTMRECNNDTATMHYDCTPGCTVCKSSLVVPTKKCVKNPTGKTFFGILGVRPCEKLFGLAVFAATGCVGNSTFEAFPDKTCFVDGESQSSVMYVC